MSDHEEVTSPDQHRPTVSGRLARLGALVTAVALVAMTVGNHEGQIENYYLWGFAGFIVLMLIIDFVLRRSGLRS